MKTVFTTIILLLIGIHQSLTSIKQEVANEEFTIILLPDTQYYSLKDGKGGHPMTYEKQTQWIADNQDSENIVFTIHLGDMTNENSHSEWKIASDAHEILDVKDIPYSVVPGNHDYVREGGHVKKNRSKIYNQYFGPDRFNGKNFYGGNFENDNDNNYCLFEHTGNKFLIISLEFAPSKDVLCWANDVISNYKDRNVIIVSHCYQRSGGSHADCVSNYDVIGSDGDDVWNELVKRHSNIIMVLSGHIGDSEFRKRQGVAGNTVYEILTDYQFEKWRDGKKYGNGWMRKLKFSPQSETVNVESFTVLEDVAEFNRGPEYYPADPNDPVHKYTIDNFKLNRKYTYSIPNIDFNDRTINQTSTLNQRKPSIETNEKVNLFVSAWEDNRLGQNNYNIYARIINFEGCSVSNEFKVCDNNQGNKYNPDIAIFNDGSFVVVWQDDRDNNGYFQIYGRLFNNLSEPISSKFVINKLTKGQQRNPKVATSNNSVFIVTWEDDNDRNNYYQIHASAFNKAAKKIITDFTVNSDGKGNQRRPNITLDSNNNFYITWEDDKDKNGYYQVYTAGFKNLSTNRLFNDIVVNNDHNGQQLRPDIDVSKDGEFTVVWEDDKDKNKVYQIYAASYDKTGKRIHNDIVVNSIPDGQQRKPRVSKDYNSGNFSVVWEDDKDGNGVYQIKHATFNRQGNRISKDHTINKLQNGQQLNPCIGSLNSYNVILWQDDVDRNNYFEIVGTNKKK